MRILSRIRNSRTSKYIAAFLAILILDPVVNTQAIIKAATGGPTQPEFAKFTAVSASDLVDPFTGNVGYNVPLMDIGGYPVTLSYSGDINMEQDAGWVGLGWSLNMGSINRALRGVPDDFNGDEVKVFEYKKPREVINVDLQHIKKERWIEEQEWEDEEIGEYFFENVEFKKNKNIKVNVTFDNYTGFGLGFGTDAIFRQDFTASVLNEELNTSVRWIDNMSFHDFVEKNPDILSKIRALIFGGGPRNGDVSAVVEYVGYVKQNFSSASKTQMGVSYNSKSGFNINLTHNELINGFGGKIGLPIGTSYNSRSGKVSIGLFTGYSTTALMQLTHQIFYTALIFIQNHLMK